MYTVLVKLYFSQVVTDIQTHQAHTLTWHKYFSGLVNYILRRNRVVYEPSANRACFVDKYIVSCTNWCRMRWRRYCTIGCCPPHHRILGCQSPSAPNVPHLPAHELLNSESTYTEREGNFRNVDRIPEEEKEGRGQSHSLGELVRLWLKHAGQEGKN